MDWVPKKSLRRQPLAGTARFLTFSCYRRLRLFDNPRIKDHFVGVLQATLSTHQVSLLAWVIMPNHVHLVVYPEDAEAIGPFLRTLKRPFARTLLDRWRACDASILPRLRDRSGQTHVWQPGGGYDRNVVAHELVEKIAYVHRNPVRDGLTPDGPSWKWSSAAAYAGRENAFGPPIAFDLIPSTEADLY
ncbi:MAG: transposase [Tepidisphaeraceae bacterium]